MSTKPTSAPAWQWPVNLEAYDRVLSFNEAERACLASLTAPSRSKRSYLLNQARPVLHRLLQPLEDALQITHPRAETRYQTLFHVLLAMHDLQSPFWAWTAEQWQMVLAEDDKVTRLGPLRDYYRHVVAVAYLLTGFSDFHCGHRILPDLLARDVFGQPALDEAQQRILHALCQLGFRPSWSQVHLPIILSYVLLLNRHFQLETLTLERMEGWFQEQKSLPYQHGLRLISYALHYLGILPKPLDRKVANVRTAEVVKDVPSEWLTWCQRWRDTSTLTPSSVRRYYDLLLKVGRWLAQTHPDLTHPQQWTRDLAAEYVAAVNQMRVGDWVVRYHRGDIGKPLSPAYKAHLCAVMRMFFRDCQEWGWIPIRFDPGRSFVTPRAVRTQLVPNPRIIADDIWAKLVWAGLNLTADDLPVHRWAEKMIEPRLLYPLEMVKAVVITWLFAGLRSDELRRLRVGCIRWQHEVGSETSRAVCLLDVPTHKTGTAFTKPVDHLVGEAIASWEKLRPLQPSLLDPKTNELVHYLFAFRGRQIGKQYLNESVIPALCRKAGVPEADARGDITSHRARSTIASQLFNAKEPMSLFELQAWLGHRSPATTQYYAKLSPTRLTQAYQNADYFKRNLRMVEVLIDQEAIKSGAAAEGEAWKFYDLGHGYCTYDFFDQCPHRMACAKCAFYRPKGSTQTQLLEAKTHLHRMLQEIPLTDDERAAVEDGLEAVEKLSTQLMDIPTPAGPTPRQLGAAGFIPLSVVSGQSKD